MPKYARGARPSPRHALCAATPFRPARAALPQVAYVPKQLSFWGNQTDGDCVTAEEFFAKDATGYFLPESLAIAWASAHGVLNGAALDQVLDWMVNDGPVVGNQHYNDGPKQSVDYSNEAVLQAAIDQGPVKIAIDANALPQNAGPPNGWYATGSKQYPNTDHCVSIAGHGPTNWLYQQLNMPMPGGLPPVGYLLFTWSSIGFVDHAWIMGTCVEAWVRNPTTVGIPPLGPTPPPPPPPPGPTPTGVKAKVNAVFDKVEDIIKRTWNRYAAQAALTALEAVRKQVNAILDQYNISAVPWVQGHIPPMVIQALDAALAGVAQQFPQYAPYILILKPIIDYWLARV